MAKIIGVWPIDYNVSKALGKKPCLFTYIFPMVALQS